MELVEIHDRKWFPKFLRDFVTDDLETILNLVNVYQPVAGRLRNALADAGTSRVVDLCSGGGGPWPWLYQALEKTSGPPVHIWLTDKYPNVAAFTRARNASGNRIHFRTDPIDAMKLPEELVGFRTFFSSFHHFSAAEARKILQDAIDHKQGIGIFEAPGRHVLTLFLVLIIPIADLLLAPSIRPFRWKRLLWTYVIPVIPMVLLVDGILSCLRVYSPTELTQMFGSLRDSGAYRWDIGVENGGIFHVPITYLMGIPNRAEQPAGDREAALRAQQSPNVKRQNLKPAAV
jgi:hypothetical protein